MYRIRAADNRLQLGIREGDFDSLHYSVRGQEAICAALGLTLNPTDYSVSTYRALGDLVARGVSLPLIFAEIIGKREGLSGAKEGRCTCPLPNWE
jgi:TPP-dependent pyruvate/acetoin dehydrogenase alpha subunit